MIDNEYYINVSVLMLPRPRTRTQTLGIDRAEPISELPIIHVRSELNELSFL